MLIKTEILINEFLKLKKETFTKDEIIIFLKDNSNKLESIETDDIIVSPQEHLVTINNVNHVLPKKEFQLLYLFMSNKGVIFTRVEILEKIWGTSWIGQRTIDVHIRRLRSKLNIKNIHTQKGIGYKWVI